MNSNRPWWRQPLLHFLAAGVAIFLFFEWRGGEVAERRDQIVITSIQIERLSTLWQQTWGRAPTDAELEKLVQDHVEEEVHVREALALGLDVDDPIVRRRMRQKMQNLIREAETIAEPTEQVLRDWFSLNQHRYARPAMYVVEQVFVADPSPQKLESVLQGLNSGAASFAMSDPSLVPNEIAGSSLSELEARFGQSFVSELPDLTPGVWSGPIRSNAGTHLVRIKTIQPAGVAGFEDLEARIRADWRQDAVRADRDARLAEIMKRYDIIIENRSE